MFLKFYILIYKIIFLSLPLWGLGGFFGGFVFAQNNWEKDFNNGKEKFEKNLFKEAISDFLIANEKYGGHKESIFLLIKCKLAINDSAGALKEYDNLIDVEKNDASFYNNRGNLKDELNQPNEAITDFDKAIFLKPDYLDAYFNRGIAYYNLQEFEKAQKDFEFVTKNNPKDAESWYGLGLTYQKLKNKEEACKAFKNAKDLQHPEVNKIFLELECK